MSTAPYACLEARSVARLPSYFGQDVTLAGVPDIPDGTYRRLGPVFLGWIHQRVEAGARKADADLEGLGRAIEFYYQARAACGLTPAPAIQVPPDYQKPQEWRLEATTAEKLTAVGQ